VECLVGLWSRGLGHCRRAKQLFVWNELRYLFSTSFYLRVAKVGYPDAFKMSCVYCCSCLVCIVVVVLCYCCSCLVCIVVVVLCVLLLVVLCALL